MLRWMLAIQDYHPQTDGLAERDIQKLVHTIRWYCAFGLEYKDKGGYTHDWVYRPPDLEIDHNTRVHSTTKRSTFELERGSNPRMAQEDFKSRDVEIQPTALNFVDMFKEAIEYAALCIEEAFS